jgi:hypothetical protein
VLNPVQRSERPRTNPNLNPGDVGADHTTAQLSSIHCKPLHNCTRFIRQPAASPTRTHCSRPDHTGTHVYLVNLTFRIDPSCKADSKFHIQKRPFILLYRHQMAQPPVGVPHLAKARKPTVKTNGKEGSRIQLLQSMQPNARDQIAMHAISFRDRTPSAASNRSLLYIHYPFLHDLPWPCPYRNSKSMPVR